MKKWIVQDRYGNEIYLTEERWHHILEARPEMEPFYRKVPGNDTHGTPQTGHLDT